METNDTINELFQKFVDKTLTSEERERFYTYLMDPDNSAQIKQLLNELWDYVKLTANREEDDADKQITGKLDQKGEELDKYIVETAKRFYEIKTIIKKLTSGCWVYQTVPELKTLRFMPAYYPTEKSNNALEFCCKPS